MKRWETTWSRRLRADGRVFLLAGAAKLVVHLLVNGRYGLHRDEYLYLAEARHLDWGYLEVPPFTPFIGWLALQLGGGIQVVRLFPTLAGLVCLWAVLAMTRAMGGGRRAAWIAALAFLVSPAYLGSNLLFQPVSFTQMWWTLLALAAVWVVRYDDDRYWYLFGVCLGLAWLTKYTVAVFGLALFFGLLLSRQRPRLAGLPFWRAVGIGALIGLPNLIWQAAHRFPVLTHMDALRSSQLVHVGLVDFLSYQLIVQGLCLLVWVAGLWWLIRSPAARPYRWIAYAWLGVIGLFVLLQGKGYYTKGAYPMLFAAGGVAWARWLASRPSWAGWALAALLVLGNLPLTPFSIPVLRVDRMAAYGQWMSRHLGFNLPLRWEDGSYRALRQDYADMLGWEEMVRRTAKLYHSLPPERRERCLLWGGSYGHAGALLYFGERYDLPEPVSLNSSFALWAPDSIRAEEMIQLDDRRKDRSEAFFRIELVDSVRQQYARDPGYLYHLTEPKTDLQRAWEAARNEAQYWRRE